MQQLQQRMRLETTALSVEMRQVDRPRGGGHILRLRGDDWQLVIDVKDGDLEPGLAVSRAIGHAQHRTARIAQRRTA